MALFDYVFGQPTQEERQRKQREAYQDLLRGAPQQAGPPQPTLGDIAGPQQFGPPEPPEQRPGITGPGGAAFGIYPSSGRQERTMPPVPDIPIPVIEQDTRPFGDIPAPETAAAPTAAAGKGKALPRATGAGGGAGRAATAAGGAATAAGGAAPAGAAAAAPVDDLEAKHKAALAEQEALLTPPDRTAAEEGYKKQALGGQRQLALALMAGGTMTETGFIEDPAYQQELKLKRADMRVKSIERAQELAASAAERARLQKEKLDADAALRREALASQRFIAEMMEGGRAERAGGGGKGKGGKGVSEASPTDMLNIIGEAELHLKNATGSGLGADIDRAARYVGYATGGAKAIGALEPIAAKLTMMQPRMEGPQSDKDRELYQQAAADVANPRKTVGERQSALQSLKHMTQKYQSGYWAPPGYKEPAGGKGGGRRATDGGGGEVDFNSL